MAAEDSAQQPWVDFLQTIWVPVFALILRHALNVAVLPLLARALPDPNSSRKRAKDTLDGLCSAGEYAVLEVLGIYVILRHNAGCSPWDTHTCLQGWPHPSPHAWQTWYMVLTCHHLLYECVAPLLGVGAKLGTDMALHHVVMMTSLVITHCFGFQRFMIMGQTLYYTAAPWKFVDRVMHAAALPQLAPIKYVPFLTFASLFFLGRIALAPFTIFPAFPEAFRILPSHWAIVMVTLLGAVFALQCYWFRVILIRKLVTLATRKGGKTHMSTTRPVRVPHGRKPTRLLSWPMWWRSTMWFRATIISTRACHALGGVSSWFTRRGYMGSVVLSRVASHSTKAHGPSKAASLAYLQRMGIVAEPAGSHNSTGAHGEAGFSKGSLSSRGSTYRVSAVCGSLAAEHDD